MKHLNKNQSKADRTLVVVDLENLCGGSGRVAGFYLEARRAIEEVVGSRAVNYVIASGPRARGDTPSLPFFWPEARWLVGRGIDGADIALVDVLIEEPFAKSSQRVVVVSGDHRFAEVLHYLASIGVSTTVISTASALSHQCRLAAHHVVTIPDFVTQTSVPQEAA